MASRPPPPSLRELATKAVRRQFVNAKGVVPLFRFFDEMDWMVVDGPALREECIKFITSIYRCMKRIYGKDVLAPIIGTEVLGRLEKDLLEVEKDMKRVRIHGKVLKRPGSVPPEAMGSRSHQLTRSVSGKSAYAYETLKTGRDWPSDVIPSKREEHLDSQDFHNVFQVSYETYRAYPSWKKTQIKKEKHLF